MGGGWNHTISATGLPNAVMQRYLPNQLQDNEVESIPGLNNIICLTSCIAAVLEEGAHSISIV